MINIKTLVQIWGFVSLLTALSVTACSNTTPTEVTEAIEAHNRDGGSALAGSQEYLRTAPAPEVRKENIVSYLHAMTAQPRESGTDGERAAVSKLQSFFSEMGYEVILQDFKQPAATKDGTDISGTNVIAVKPADGDEPADILIISAHHDTRPGSAGANDNASGVAVMLETANALRLQDSDTELRFISFSGEANGQVGSRTYAQSLTAEEKARIIGVVHLDELGYLHSESLQLRTADGRETLLGKLLNENLPADAADKLQTGPLTYIQDTRGDHYSFAQNQIPAVMLTQDCQSFEKYSTQDKAETLDMEKLVAAAELTANTAAQVMNQNIGSYVAEAYRINPARKGGEILPETILHFGKDYNYVENMLCICGTEQTMAAETEAKPGESGDALLYRDYALRWFHMEEPLISTFTYRNGYLEQIHIAMGQQGYSPAEARSIITAALGEPSDETTIEQGMERNWEDPIYHKKITLISSAAETSTGVCDIIVTDFSHGSERFGTYELNLPESWAVMDKQDRDLLSMAESIIYPEDREFLSLVTYTDGRMNSRGHSDPVAGSDNSRMELWLDRYDVFDEKGAYRNYNKMLAVFVHEYGHILSLNSAQVDITAEDPEDTLPTIRFEHETFAEDAYLRRFYQRFWSDPEMVGGPERYKTDPTDFVTEYAAADIAEDFAETFKLFVLSEEPELDLLKDRTLATQKIRFFYEDAAMIARRDYIREQLGIDRELAELPQ